MMERNGTKMETFADYILSKKGEYVAIWTDIPYIGLIKDVLDDAVILSDVSAVLEFENLSSIKRKEDFQCNMVMRFAHIVQVSQPKFIGCKTQKPQSTRPGTIRLFRNDT